MRVRSKWKAKGKPRSVEDVGSTLAFIAWQIGGQGVLNLENEGFQTDDRRQRLAVIEEFAAFVLHLTDRLCYDELEQGQRAAFIVAIARKLADHIYNNMREIGLEGDHRTAFIELLNARMADYAEMPFGQGEPGFQMVRLFGDNVTRVMGERDKKWITDQIMAIEAPLALKTLKRALNDLLLDLKAEAADEERGEN
ncbi:MAG: hypothetical protein AMJ69_01125 [Gammaproteobacteria bacterium SG8_47]|nr:MAG: hypothetical protein AMJ69_01125 [Gammaproteobacteria bacterium SG8_47]